MGGATILLLFSTEKIVIPNVPVIGNTHIPVINGKRAVPFSCLVNGKKISIYINYVNGAYVPATTICYFATRGLAAIKNNKE